MTAVTVVSNGHPYAVGGRYLGHFSGDDCRKQSACGEVFLLWKSWRLSEGEEAEAVYAEVSVVGDRASTACMWGPLRGRLGGQGAPREGGSPNLRAVRRVLGFSGRHSVGNRARVGTLSVAEPSGQSLTGLSSDCPPV